MKSGISRVTKEAILCLYLLFPPTFEKPWNNKCTKGTKDTVFLVQHVIENRLLISSHLNCNLTE